MATDKPRFSITMDTATLNQVEEFRHKNRIKSQSRAIIQLLEIGLEDLAKDGVVAPKASPYSSEAEKLARDYDDLDEYGKKSLQDTLKKEQDRMEREIALQESLQAFINSFTILRVYKKPITDKTGIDLAAKPEPKMIQITSKTPKEQATTIRQVMRTKNAFGVRFRFDDG